MRVRFDRVWTGSEANPSRPVSRVLYGRGSSPRRDGHSSGTPVTGRLEQPTRAAGPTDKALRRLTRRASLLFGFAPGGACHAADVAARAVGSYRTLSPLPSRLMAFRPAIRRFAFCGAFPGVAPAGRYPAPYPYGARTFLRFLDGGRPADWRRRSYGAKARAVKQNRTWPEAGLEPMTWLVH